jgi:hypothetical protein
MLIRSRQEPFEIEGRIGQSDQRDRSTGPPGDDRGLVSDRRLPELLQVEPYVRLREEHRTQRHTIADVLEVVHEKLGLTEIPAGRIALLQVTLPWKETTAFVDVVFTDLGCAVSLPMSGRFTARTETEPQRIEYDISDLRDAEVCSDGSVRLANGTWLRAVEVLPTFLPHKPSAEERTHWDDGERILLHVIVLTKSFFCFRMLRDSLPPDLQHRVHDLWAVDYSRVHEIKAPPLKVIRAHIEDNDPELDISNQTIANALQEFGVRIPLPRPRVVLSRRYAAAI